MDDKLSRRKLLELLHKHVWALPALGSCLSSCAKEQIAVAKSLSSNSTGRSKDNKFMLYIHFGLGGWTDYRHVATQRSSY